VLAVLDCLQDDPSPKFDGAGDFDDDIYLTSPT